MAIYTFSTKSTRPDDDEVVKRAKKECAEKNINFSALVISLLREREKANGAKR